MTGTLTAARRTVRRTRLVAIGMLAAMALFAGCKQTPSPATSENPAGRTAEALPKPLAVPFTKKHIYSETADPKTDITAALAQAKRERKRVLIDFGGDWCGDCQVLDIYFHQSPNDDLLAKNFVLAHVFVDSAIDNHLDVGTKYGVPLKKGVPALAVLDASGKLIHAQQAGEFENMRHMDAQSVTDFLNRWKS